MIAQIPEGVRYETAAALPTAGLPAYQIIVEAIQAAPQMTILIHGAAGGVGHYAVQLAKLKGARIIANASDRDSDYLRRLGADEVLDHERQRFEEWVHGVDAVIDLVGGDTLRRSYQVVKTGGKIVTTTGSIDPEEARRLGIEVVRFVMRPDGKQLAALMDLLVRGQLEVRVDQVLMLADARRAEDLSQKGQARGKIVLKVL